MTQVRVTLQYLQDIADAIRSKLGVSSTYKPSQMASAIESIPSSYAMGDIYHGTDDPSSSQGSNGDVYLKESKSMLVPDDTTMIEYIANPYRIVRHEGETVIAVAPWINASVKRTSMSHDGGLSTNTNLLCNAENLAVEVKYLDPSDESFTGNAHLFGSPISQHTMFRTLITRDSDGDKLSFTTGGESWDTGSDRFSFDEPHVVKLMDDGTAYVDGVAYQASQTPSEDNWNEYITAFNSSSSLAASSFHGLLYYIKVWSGDTLLAYLVPFIDEYGNVGMYDVVREERHYSENYWDEARELMAGPSVSMPSVYVKANNAWEIISDIDAFEGE